MIKIIIPRHDSDHGSFSLTHPAAYEKLEHREHVLKRPDMYIGSVKKVEEEQWIMGPNGKLEYKRVSFAPGLYKIFDEILVNAADNYQRDRSQKHIKVWLHPETNTISVQNDGRAIPVEMHPKYKIYVPELIFGHLLAGTNFNDDEKRVVGGRNGLGAKLTNIFSTEFTVECADGPNTGKKFKQVFTQNMAVRGDPVIKECRSSESWTKITFKPDLARFDMTGWDADAVGLLTRRVWDVAGCNSDIKVFLNDQEIKMKNFAQYVQMYRAATDSSKAEEKVEVETIKDEKGLRRWEVAIALSDGELKQVSFVNSICTSRGGTHVQNIADKVVKFVQPLIEKRSKGMPVKPQYVKSHLWVFVNCLIDNPEFDSQSKETLKTKVSQFGSKCELSEKFLKKVSKSGLVELVLEFSNFRGKKELSKVGGGKKKRITGVHKSASLYLFKLNHLNHQISRCQQCRDEKSGGLHSHFNRG